MLLPVNRVRWPKDCDEEQTRQPQAKATQLVRGQMVVDSERSRWWFVGLLVVGGSLQADGELRLTRQRSQLAAA